MNIKMITPMNDQEIKVANKAIERYRHRIDDINKQKKFLETKKFHFGDIIIKKNTKNSIEVAFNVGEGTIGKIIGWDFKWNYYRVFYSKHNPYIGVTEDEIEKYNNTACDEIEKYNPYDLI